MSLSIAGGTYKGEGGDVSTRRMDVIIVQQGLSGPNQGDLFTYTNYFSCSEFLLFVHFVSKSTSSNV